MAWKVAGSFSQAHNDITLTLTFLKNSTQDGIRRSQFPLKSNIKMEPVKHMSLSETTKKVLRLVEDRSGIPVHVEPDPNLPGIPSLELGFYVLPPASLVAESKHFANESL
jgi:hypothetical protein